MYITKCITPNISLVKLNKLAKNTVQIASTSQRAIITVSAKDW